MQNTFTNPFRSRSAQQNPSRHAEHNARYARLAALNTRSEGLSLMTPDSVASERDAREVSE